MIQNIKKIFPACKFSIFIIFYNFW